MIVLDFYKVVTGDVTIKIYNQDDDIAYYHGEACNIPVQYLYFVIRHISASYNPEHNSIEYMLWV